MFNIVIKPRTYYLKMHAMANITRIFFVMAIFLKKNNTIRPTIQLGLQYTLTFTLRYWRRCVRNTSYLTNHRLQKNIGNSVA